MAITLRSTLVYLTIAFVIVFVWRDPYGASDMIGDFLAGVGRLLILIVDKAAEFLSGLSR